MTKVVKEVAKSEFFLVNEIAVALNLGDFGKVEGFFRKTVKSLGREIETAERSIVNVKHNAESVMRGLVEVLEDKQQAATEAYTNVAPEDLKNNDAQRKYMKTYLAAIAHAEGIVKGQEAIIKEAEEVTDAEVKRLTEEIDVRKAIIAKVGKKQK
jgi:hypothetical protein